MTKRGQETTVRKPPYVSWSVFKQVLDKIRARGPRNVDLTLLEGWQVSKPTARKVLPALKFLGILDEQGEPQAETWQALTSSDTAKYSAALKKVVEAAYAKLFETLKDVASASSSDLEEAFYEAYGVEVSSRQAVAGFFAAISREAGIELAAEPRPATPRSKGRQRKGASKKEASKVKVTGEKSPAKGADGVPVVITVTVTGTESDQELEQRLERIKKAYEKVFGSKE